LYQDNKIKVNEISVRVGTSWKRNLYKLTRIARIPAEKRQFGIHVMLDVTVEVGTSGVGCDG
jgi:hypothetical protein